MSINQEITQKVENLKVEWNEKFSTLNSLMQELQILLSHSRTPNTKTPYTSTEKNNLEILNNGIIILKQDLKDILKSIELLLEELEEDNGDEQEATDMLQDKEASDKKALEEEEEEKEKELLLELMKILNMLKNNVLDITQALNMIGKIGQHFVAKLKVGIPMNSYTQQSFVEMKKVIEEIDNKTNKTFEFKNNYEHKMILSGSSEKVKKIKKVNNQNNVFSPTPELK